MFSFIKRIATLVFCLLISCSFTACEKNKKWELLQLPKHNLSLRKMIKERPSPLMWMERLKIQDFMI